MLIVWKQQSNLSSHRSQHVDPKRINSFECKCKRLTNEPMKATSSTQHINIVNYLQSYTIIRLATNAKTLRRKLEPAIRFAEHVGKVWASGRNFSGSTAKRVIWIARDRSRTCCLNSLPAGLLTSAAAAKSEPPHDLAREKRTRFLLDPILFDTSAPANLTLWTFLPVM